LKKGQKKKLFSLIFFFLLFFFLHKTHALNFTKRKEKKQMNKEGYFINSEDDPFVKKWGNKWFYENAIKYHGFTCDELKFQDDLLEDNNARKIMTDMVGKLFDDRDICRDERCMLYSKEKISVPEIVAPGEFIRVSFVENTYWFDRRAIYEFPIYLDSYGHLRPITPANVTVGDGIDYRLIVKGPSPCSFVQSHRDINDRTLESVFEHIAQCFFHYGIDLREFDIVLMSLKLLVCYRDIPFLVTFMLKKK
jgi:hypothetical protein